MQIFATFDDPKLCAIVLDDKRVCKMIVESAQIMSTVMHLKGSKKAPYKKTHINHPCVLWTSTCPANFKWLFHHFEHLLIEYSNRFDNKKHKCGDLTTTFIDFMLWWRNKPTTYKVKFRTEFPNVTIFGIASEEAYYENVNQLYRRHLIEKWYKDKRKPKWYGESITGTYEHFLENIQFYEVDHAR